MSLESWAGCRPTRGCPCSMTSPKTSAAYSASEMAGARTPGRNRPVEFTPIGSEHAQALSDLFERNSGSSVPSSFDPFPLSDEQARHIALEQRSDRYYA